MFDIKKKLRRWLFTDEERQLAEELTVLDNKVDRLEDDEHPFDFALRNATKVDEYEGNADVVILYGADHSYINANVEDGDMAATVASKFSTASIR